MKIITDNAEIQPAFSQFKADKNGAYATGRCLPGQYEQANCEEWQERGLLNDAPAKVTYLFDRTQDGIDGDPETYPWDDDHITSIEIADKDDDGDYEPI